MEILEEKFPNLKDESIYWAPEIFWFKVNQFTNIDVNEIIAIYEKEPNDCLLTIRRKLQTIINQCVE